MPKIFLSILMAGLLFVLPCQAATMSPACSNMTLQVVDRGEEEHVADDCGSYPGCQQRDDGKVAYKERFVRLKVVLRALDADCPGPGTVYRAVAIITEDRIRASLVSFQDPQKDDSSMLLELRNIRSMKGSRLPGISSLVVKME